MTSGYRVKRAYDAPAEGDGKRVLVDRLWPRGVRREEAGIDLWAKDATPSNELRKWYHENRDQRGVFEERYDAELEGDAQRAALQEVRDLHAEHAVTLITAAKDVEHSHVPVLLRHLEEGA